ncbi:hypothetical protein R3I93_019984 [Phoxinus phoxinus]|uniref:Uncharacterized protein n=1 Tax=Phoxinus phoxinus TaxID=58324 RepID=A0AAN9CC84_9TELE
MAKRYSAEETLVYLLQSSDDEETDTVSEEEALTEADPNESGGDMDEETEEDLEEREGHETFPSKNREILWSSIPLPQTTGRGGQKNCPRTNQVCHCKG